MGEQPTTTDRAVEGDSPADDLDALAGYVEERIDEIEADERLSYDAATVQVNAPLALHQTAQEARLSELRTVLRAVESRRDSTGAADAE